MLGDINSKVFVFAEINSLGVSKGTDNIYIHVRRLSIMEHFMSLSIYCLSDYLFYGFSWANVYLNFNKCVIARARAQYIIHRPHLSV